MNTNDNTRNAKGTLNSPVTQAIVAHLQANGPCSLAELDRVVAHFDGFGPNGARKRLVRVMHKLKEAGHAHQIERGDAKLWAHGARPRNAPTAELAPAEAAEVLAVVPAVVPPAQYNRMAAVNYRPDSGPALRPGALDFKRVATVGQRC